MNKSKHKMRGK